MTQIRPLGLPVGSVRAIIAIIAVLSVVLSFCIENIKMQETFVPITSLIIGYYFAKRSNEMQ